MKQIAASLSIYLDEAYSSFLNAPYAVVHHSERAGHRKVHLYYSGTAGRDERRLHAASGRRGELSFAIDL